MTMPTDCGHKCHTQGLNPWVVRCPVCGCANGRYDPTQTPRFYFTDAIPNDPKIVERVKAKAQARRERRAEKRLRNHLRATSPF